MYHDIFGTPITKGCVLAFIAHSHDDLPGEIVVAYVDETSFEDGVMARTVRRDIRHGWATTFCGRAHLVWRPERRCVVLSGITKTQGLIALARVYDDIREELCKTT